MSVLSFTPSPSLATSLFGRSSFLSDIVVILAGSALIALTAQIAVPLPFTPIPVTGQTFGVLVVGMALGSWRGGLAVIAYLIEGAMGLPVFAGGTSGFIVLVGPTSGYLLGFVPAAFLTGYLAERGWDRNPISTALAMLVGNIVIYIPGLLVLGFILGVSPIKAASFGFVPFWSGDVLKLLLAAAVMPLTWKFLGKFLGKK